MKFDLHGFRLFDAIEEIINNIKNTRNAITDDKSVSKVFTKDIIRTPKEATTDLEMKYTPIITSPENPTLPDLYQANPL